MSFSSTATATSSTSADPNHNPNLHPSINGPSVYLYGFLATLVFIFLVSICVAWKGYRTRRLLRTRIDEAIARGTLIPGYDPSNPNLPLFSRTTPSSRRRDAPRPIMYEEWIGERAVRVDVENGGVEGMWGIKPTALDALRPYEPIPSLNTQPSHATSWISQILDPLRQYWFVRPPQGAHANQLQGRPGRRRDENIGRRDGGADIIYRVEGEQMEKKGMEEGMGLLGVREVVASVLIAMPDRIHPKWAVRGAAAAVVGYDAGAGGGSNAITSGSRPSSGQQQQQQPAVASSSRPTSSSAPGHAAGAGYTVPHGATSSIVTAAILEKERKELPELVLGVVLLGLKEVREAVEEEGTQEVETEGEVGEGKGKESVVTTPP